MQQGYMGTTMNLQIEDTCQNFPTPPPPPKKKNIENFKPPKILQSSLSLEIRSTPLGDKAGL